MTEEDFKGAVHATAASLFAVMAAYNAMRLVSTRKTRNAVNVGIYVPLLVWEMTQVHHHWSREDIR